MKIEDYNIRLFWSELDKIWVAEIPELPFCCGDGKTQMDAVKALSKTFQVFIEVYNEENIELPLPQSMSVDIKSLKRSVPFIKLSALARKARLNRSTLKAKIQSNRELSFQESEKLGRALVGSGISLLH